MINLEEEMLDFAKDEYEPEELLVISIMEQAFKDGDHKYFDSLEFQHHCDILNLNSAVVREGCLNRLLDL